MDILTVFRTPGYVSIAGWRYSRHGLELQVPPPRVTMKLEDRANSNIADPPSLNKLYHAAKMWSNRRITSSDWYQDVRQIELSFHDEIRYDPSFNPNSNGLNQISYSPGGRCNHPPRDSDSDMRFRWPRLEYNRFR